MISDDWRSVLRDKKANDKFDLPLFWTVIVVLTLLICIALMLHITFNTGRIHFE